MQTLQAVNSTPRHIIQHQQAMYCQLLRARAMAGGLGAIATNAQDAGEASPDQVNDIVELSALLTEHLSELAHVFAESPDHR